MKQIEFLRATRDGMELGGAAQMTLLENLDLLD
jgi:hypothetical protein